MTNVAKSESLLVAVPGPIPKQTLMPRGAETSEPVAEHSAGDELHPEEWYREREKTELEALIDPPIAADVGARPDRTLRPR